MPEVVEVVEIGETTDGTEVEARERRNGRVNPPGARGPMGALAETVPTEPNPEKFELRRITTIARSPQARSQGPGSPQEGRGGRFERSSTGHSP